MESYQKALNYAFLLLKYRPRTRNEIVLRLRRKKYPSYVIDKTVVYLKAYNYIDDSEFAQSYVSSSVQKGFGKRRIIFSLKKLGIPQDLAEKFLKDYGQSDISELLKKKIIFYRGKKNAKQKILRHFLARGFEYGDIIRQLEGLGLVNYED